MTLFEALSAMEDIPHEELAPETAAALRGKGETVLVVEDERIVRRVVARKLTQLGYRVLEAESAHAALTVCATTFAPIDLVISDFVMPEINGRQLVDQIKAQFPKIAVIFMSGYTEEMIADQGIIEPGISFLEKTSLSQSLAAKVRTALDQKRSNIPASDAPPATQV